MAEIITLRGSGHDGVQELLPWYLNDTLDADERATVDAHLATCEECRAELAGERKLARAVASLPVDVEQGWSALAARIAAKPAVPFWRRRVPIGWAAGLPVAAAATVAAAFTALPVAAPVQTYTALGSPDTAPKANIVAIFRPTATDRAMRAALDQAGARIVGGPNASGAYMLRVAPEQRSKAIAGLRASPDLVLAEPIDAGAQP